MRRKGVTVPSSSWHRLGERIFYVPLQTVRNVEESNGGKRVRFFHIEKNGRKFVPVFSTEELFFDWSTEGNQQFLPVAGADLLLVLPKQFSLEFDSGNKHSFLLNREELEVVLSDEIMNQTFEDSVTLAPVENLAEQTTTAVPSDENVEIEIVEILKKYPAVLEAYYLGAERLGESSGNLGGLLGLLVADERSGTPWDTEQRFAIVEAVAELSRKVYGYAGAIEVYDDLSNEVSKSWDLFKGQKLFYQTERKDEWANSEQSAAPKSAARMGMFPGQRAR